LFTGEPLEAVSHARPLIGKDWDRIDISEAEDGQWSDVRAPFLLSGAFPRPRQGRVLASE
jgi:hypothetical protein